VAEAFYPISPFFSILPIVTDLGPSMRRPDRIWMRVLVMRIMEMRVFVLHGQMAMQVRVAFREVQPHAGPHE
jgi:hypothetical protein